MGLKTIATKGPDAYFINNGGAGGIHYAPTYQAVAAPCKLYNLHLEVRAAVAANRVICVYDDAAGTSSDVNPRLVVPVAFGTLVNLNFGEEIVFNNGIYVIVATAEPATAGATVTAGSNDDAILIGDYRQ